MKNVYKIDLVLIIVSVVVLIGLVGYVRPLVIAPLDDYESSGEVLFLTPLDSLRHQTGRVSLDNINDDLRIL